MSLDSFPNEMGIPAVLIAAVILISLAMWLLDILFPATHQPARKRGPR